MVALSPSNPPPVERPPVVICVDNVLFDGFIETDPAVVRVLAAAVDLECEAHRLLGLGARVVDFAADSGQADAMGGRLDAMTTEVEAAVGGSITELQAFVVSLLDAEEGEAARILGHFIHELTETLDPSRRDSVGAGLADSLRSVMESVLKAHARQVSNLIDPLDAKGPIGRVVQLVEDNNETLAQEVRRLAEVVSAERARADGLERSGAKGRPYEEAVCHIVADLAALTGDAAEHVGRERGAAGTFKGDIVVHINPADASGRTIRYAVETKTGKKGLRPILAELDEVIANREALAAVAVYGDARLAPCKVPFQPYDNRALVVLDRTDFDARALQLACLWARWVARRQCNAEIAGPNLDAMGVLIERARRALARAAEIRRALSTASKSISQARAQVDELVSEVDAALHALAAELNT